MLEERLEFDDKFSYLILGEDEFSFFFRASDRKIHEYVFRDDSDGSFDLERVEILPEFAFFLFDQPSFFGLLVQFARDGQHEVF